MGDVISLDSARPHMQGPAVCLHCKTTWDAVALAGTWHLECPSCGLWKGVFQGLALAADGDQVWTCDCGGTLFQCTRSVGWRCVTCGSLDDRFDDDGEPA